MTDKGLYELWNVIVEIIGAMIGIGVVLLIMSY